MGLFRAGSLKKRRMFRLFKPILFLTVVSISISLALTGTSRKVRIMPLGDSITGSFEGMASYRFWLWESLVAAGFGDKIEFVGQRCGCGDIDGACGASLYDCSVWSCHHNGFHDKTIFDIYDKICRNPSFLRTDTADIVMIHLGTNDIDHPDWPTLEGSKTSLGSMIDSIRSVNPRVTVLLCQIIPGAFSNESTDSLIKLNGLISQIASEKNQQYSPVILVDQFHGFSGSDLMPDGFHPNQNGEIKMAKKFFLALLPVLNSIKGITSHIPTYTHDERISAGAAINLNAQVKAYPCAKDVVFMNDSLLLGHANRVSDSLFSFSFNPMQSGFYNVKAIVSDFSGHTDTSATILFGAPGNSNPLALTIPQIQGPGSQSPNVNLLVQTSGVVTAVQKDSSGFWMQDALGDGNPLTSDAIFVSRNSSVALPAKGNVVSVEGIVQEYQASPNYLTSTRLACVDSIVVETNNHGLPAPALISNIGNGPGDISTLESGYSAYKGMLVKFAATAIVSPSGQPAFIPFGNLASGSGFYFSNRVAINESRSANVVDYNPEVLLIGSKTADIPLVRAQDTLFSMTGVVDYDKGWLCIQPLADSLSLSHSSKPFSPISKRGSAGSLKISTFDMGGFFDTFDTWGKNDPIMTGPDYAVKLAKMTKAISQELSMPAILCVQNVENTGILADLAASVNSLAGGNYKAATARTYMGFSVDKPGSPDPRGVTNGFLFDTTLCKLDSIKLLSGPAVDSAFGRYSPLATAEPLVGMFKINVASLVIVNVSLVDKNADNPCFSAVWPIGEQSKRVRKTQAYAIRAWINATLASSPSIPMIVAGEFNDYAFGETLDGANYPVSIVAGNAGKGETVFYNAYDYLPVDSRYTCIVNGRAQMTEHLMVNPAIASYAKGIDVLHFNANFEDSFVTDSTTAARCSSHDPIEVRF